MVAPFLSTAPGAWAQTAAERLTLVVPYPSGGITDMAARALAERMSAQLGQTIVEIGRAHV